MISSRTESEWDEEQRAWIVADELLRLRTGTNGEYLPEATSPGADPNNYESGFSYRAEGPFTNWAEKAKQDARAAFVEANGKDANLNGRYWVPVLTRYEVPDKD